MTDDEPFLARWSRKKLETARTDPPVAVTPAPAAPMPVATAQEAAPTAPELPAVDSLDGLRSTYETFMRKEVDEGTRRAALKKLFADPHFNTMDGLDVYIDDYSIPDPIPAAMLRGLAHAKDLLFKDLPKDDAAIAAHAPEAPPQDEASESAAAKAPEPPSESAAT